MSEPSFNLPNEYTQRGWQADKEARLEELRKRAREFGVVDAKGIQPKGAPFPIASPTTGYYGIPLLKPPQWNPGIPVYFFVGGASGSAAVIGAIAHWTGRDPKLARDARLLAAVGSIVSGGLLIADLGRPSRFLYMLRMFKPQSPMSMGAWILSGFGATSGAAAAAQLFTDRFGFTPVRILGNIAEGLAALFGLPFSNYTGVLIGATAIPVWNSNVGILPFYFGMSGLNAGVSILEFMGNDTSRPLNRLGIVASAAETYEEVELELKRDPVVNAPVRRGATAWTTRLGGLLSGPLPLALRLAAEFTGPRRSRQLRQVAAGATIAGSLLTRIGWVRAGHASAKDWRIPLDLKNVPKVQEMQSQAELPRLRKIG